MAFALPGLTGFPTRLASVKEMTAPSPCLSLISRTTSGERALHPAHCFRYHAMYRGGYCARPWCPVHPHGAAAPNPAKLSQLDRIPSPLNPRRGLRLSRFPGKRGDIPVIDPWHQHPVSLPRPAASACGSHRGAEFLRGSHVSPRAKGPCVPFCRLSFLIYH